MQPLKISVVTVSYNAATTIEETILSVVDQTYDNIEYIVIDGGSTDGTVDIIKRYSEGGSEYGKHNNSISYWVSEPDKGIYDAMNKGIAAATGNYILFLGADDTFIGDLEKVCYLLTNVDILYVPVNIKSTGKKYFAYFNKFSLVRKNVPHQGIFYSRSLLNKLKYNPKYKLYADWFLNIQCASIKLRKKFVDYPIVLYNDLGQSGISFDDVFLNDLEENTKKYLGILPYLYLELILFKRFIFKLFNH